VFGSETSRIRAPFASSASSAAWHLAFTPGVAPLEVKIDGKVVFTDGKPTRVDAAEVRARAAEQAARLHALL